jgi:hypothetical protein
MKVYEIRAALLSRRRYVYLLAAVLLLAALGLGAYTLQKNKTVALSASALNFSPDDIISVAVNGKWAGGASCTRLTPPSGGAPPGAA